MCDYYSCYQNCYQTCYNPCDPCTTIYVCNQCPSEPTILEATLSGLMEVPPNLSTARGSLIAVLNADKTKLRFILTTFGLVNITAAHFHLGPVGQVGPIVKTILIDPVTGRASGTWACNDSEPLTPALVNALLTGGIYVNVHTAAFPTGEIRGQLNVVNV